MTLVERLEKATGASRELDIAIDLIVRPDEWSGLAHEAGTVPNLALFNDAELPRYTASIDAALTLAPSGAGWNVQGNTDVFYAAVRGCTSGQSKKTPALALCIAALRARQHGEG